MGVAGIIFASAFSRCKQASQSLAFNLYGAVLGGLLEYLSNYLGIKALVLVAALLYLASMICMFKGKSSAKSVTANPVAQDT
jgi:hypothetical protein